MEEFRIAIAAAAMLLLAGGVVVFVLLYQRRVIRHQLDLKKLEQQKQHDLLQASIRAGETERQRIAEELHDDVGATLSSIRLFLHARDGAAPKPAALPQIKELLDEAIGKVRSLSHQLQPALLQRLGLEAALKSYTETLGSSGALAVHFVQLGPLPKLPPDTELAVYRIVQELATNAIRHGRATTLWVETGGGVAEQWCVTFLHNGRGLTQEDFDAQLFKPDAIGLKNIATRVALIRAVLRFSLAADSRFRAEICGIEKES